MVSHDRYLLQRVTDDVMGLLGDGKITHLPGGVDEYLRRRAAAEAAASAGAGPIAAAAAGPAESPSGTSAIRGASEIRTLRKELQRLERRMESVQRKQNQLHAELAAVGADFARAGELDGQLKAATADRQRAEVAWLEVAEKLEG